MTLDQLCHGRECFLRFPGICNGNSATVVPCHIRRGHISGRGQKPVPICCLPGCFDCHNAYDGRTKSDYTRDELDAMVLVGLVQWLSYLWAEELIIAPLGRRIKSEAV